MLSTAAFTRGVPRKYDIARLDDGASTRDDVGVIFIEETSGGPGVWHKIGRMGSRRDRV
jgi:hypothetical protein